MGISFDWDKKSIEREEPGFEDVLKHGGRKIKYAEALHEAFDEILATNDKVFVMGQGADDPFGMFGSILDLYKKYGNERIFDTPLSEDSLTGVAVGAALAGLRPVYMHNRPDFLLLAMDQIVNHASKWHYMFGGKISVPLVIWAVIGRGWGSAAQHSQCIQGLLMHIPGLKIVMPSTPYDSKGLLVSSIFDDNPVIILEHRWLLKGSGYVPKGLYTIPFGKGVVKRGGKDVTIVGTSYMIVEAIRAAEELSRENIEVEVIDLRTLKPLDEAIILESVKKTGRLVITDVGWKTAGVTAEIAAVVAEKGFSYLKRPIKRAASLDIPTPACHILEKKFYADVKDIISSVKELMK
ncbi:MAG: pyruvate dehydrogenase complex E1 component subunit beta [Candidatus Omnitrophota bacterium]